MASAPHVYVVHLETLDGQRATFEHEAHGTRLSIWRSDWERLGRPSTLDATLLRASFT